jgi:hypothetical protein
MTCPASSPGGPSLPITHPETTPVKKVSDPELVRLIEAYHHAESEMNRLQDLSSQADDAYQESSKALAEYYAEAHEERDEGADSLIGWQSFLYKGRVYSCEDLRDPADRDAAPRHHVTHRQLQQLVG